MRGRVASPRLKTMGEDTLAAPAQADSRHKPCLAVDGRNLMEQEAVDRRQSFASGRSRSATRRVAMPGSHLGEVDAAVPVDAAVDRGQLRELARRQAARIRRRLQSPKR